MLNPCRNNPIVAKSLKYSSLTKSSIRPIITSSTTNQQAILNSSTITIDKPLVTGSGPFVEVPKFKPIGNPAKILQVVLPQSSKLNVRSISNSIIAIDNSSTDQAPDNEAFIVNNKHSVIDYQEIYSKCDLNLIIQGNNENNFKLIELKNQQLKSQDDWIILQDYNLIGWIDNFKLNIESIDLLDKFSSLKVNGNGYVLIDGGSNEVYELDLDENEDMLVNLNSLIAINKPSSISLATDLKYQVIPYFNGIYNPISSYVRIPKFSIPKYGITSEVFNPIRKSIDTLANNYKKFVQNIKTEADKYHWLNIIRANTTKIYQYIYSKLFYNSEGILLRRNPIFMKIKGPAKLIMNNNETINNNRLFTFKEIKSIN